MNSRTRRLKRVTAQLGALSLFLFLVLPLFIVIPMSFSSALSLRFPPPSFSVGYYIEFFQDATWVNAALTSFKVGVPAAIIATLLGTPAAFAIQRYEFKGKQAMRSLLVMPLVTPSIVIGVAAYLVLAQLRLVHNVGALTAVYAALAVPYVLVVVGASLEQFDMDLQRAALSLGASPWRAFRRVVLPLNMPGIIAGCLFAFVFAFGEIVVAIFIAGGQSTTLPKKIWDGVYLEVDPVISVVTTLMIILTLVMLGASTLVQRWRSQSTVRESE